MNDTDFAILIPHFNQVKDLKSVILSCAEAILSDRAHLVVVDDCSFEGVDLSFIDQFSAVFKKITIIKNPNNLGVSKSLNIGLSAIEEPFFFRIDADDRVKVHRFERQLLLLTEGYELVFSDAEIVYNQRVLCRTFLPSIVEVKKVISEKCLLLHPTLGASTGFFKAKGGYPDEFRSGQDWHFWKKYLSEAKSYLIPEPLIQLGLRHDSVSNSKFKVKSGILFELKTCLRYGDRKAALREGRNLGLLYYIAVFICPNPYVLMRKILIFRCLINRLLKRLS